MEIDRNGETIELTKQHEIENPRNVQQFFLFKRIVSYAEVVEVLLRPAEEGEGQARVYSLSTIRQKNGVKS